MSNGLSIIGQKEIENRIFTLRSIQVMIDRDIAEMYDIETKVLNQAVKRNIERFPVTFRFQLFESEKNELVTNCDRFSQLKSNVVAESRYYSRSQIVTLNERGKHSKYLPIAFTEEIIKLNKLEPHET